MLDEPLLYYATDLDFMKYIRVLLKVSHHKKYS